MQTLGGPNDEHWSNEYLPGTDSTAPYTAVNHADALPLTRYTGTMGNEGPPHMAIVCTYPISLYAPVADGGCVEGP